MNYFKCAICGMYKDDGNPEISVCAMCILRNRKLKGRFYFI